MKKIALNAGWQTARNQMIGEVNDAVSMPFQVLQETMDRPESDGGCRSGAHQHTDRL